MKKLLFLLLFSFNSFIIKAQESQHWNKFYEQIYGSQSEYREQVALRNSHKYDLYRLIGFKSYYTNGPSGFIQQEKNFSMDAKEGKGKMIYTLTGKNLSGKKETCYLSFWLDKNDRVEKAKFTGSEDIIKFLFINYWPSGSNKIDKNSLVKGEKTEKEMSGEKVVFDYTGRKPFIEVSKAEKEI